MNAFYLQKASKTASFKILIGSIYDLFNHFDWFILICLSDLQPAYPSVSLPYSRYPCLSVCISLSVFLLEFVCVVMSECLFPCLHLLCLFMFFFMFIYKRKRVILPKYDPWTFFRNTEKIEQVTFLNLIFSETELQCSVWVIEMCLLLLMLFELFALKQPFADILQNTYS